MFDSVLAKTKPPQGNVAGLALATVVFTAIVGTTAYLGTRPPEPVKHEVDVKLVKAKPPPPPPPPEAPPPPPPPPAAAVQPERKPQKKKIIEPKPQQIPDPEPVIAPPPPQETAAQPAGEPGGMPGGVPGGVAGGVLGGVVGGKLGGTTAIPFGLGMTRPTQVGGNPPAYSREAIAARVEGKVMVRCVITVDGAVKDCKVIKGVPFLDVIAVDALSKSKFTPVMYRGQPAAVQYLFTFNFKLP